MTRKALALLFPVYVALMGLGCWLILLVAESMSL